MHQRSFHTLPPGEQIPVAYTSVFSYTALYIYWYIDGLGRSFLLLHSVHPCRVRHWWTRRKRDAMDTTLDLCVCSSLLGRPFQ